MKLINVFGYWVNPAYITQLEEWSYDFDESDYGTYIYMCGAAAIRVPGKTPDEIMAVIHSKGGVSNA